MCTYKIPPHAKRNHEARRRLSPISERFGSMFGAKGRAERGFDTRVVVGENEMGSPAHKVDCCKNRAAIEIEWNKKDPF